MNWKLLKEDLKNCYLVFVILGVVFGLMYIVYKTICPLVLVTGFPCPGCGLTRAGLSALSLNFTRAWHYNPFIFAIGGIALVLFVYRYILEKKFPYLIQTLVILIVAMCIYYIYRMVTWFPDLTPMIYAENNLMKQLFDILHKK